jgi:hypothetical protein
MSDSGYVKDAHYQFLLKYFPGNIIYERFSTIWNEVVIVVKGMKLESKVRIDEESFQMFILDYFTDIARLKDFQAIERANVNKIYAYTLYWFLKRHSIQLVEVVPDYFDINEKIGIAIVMPKILTEAGIKYEKMTSDVKKRMNEFTNLLFYNLKYRLYSAQSIELMIEAFLCGYCSGSSQIPVS